MILKQFCRRQAGRLRLSTVSCAMHATGATIAAAILMSGVLGHQLLFSRYQALHDDYLSAVALRAEADAIATADQKTQAELELAKTHQQQVYERVPQRPNEITFLDQLSAVANRTGLQIRDYRPGTRTEHATHHEIELILRAEGSYESLCHFVASLESLPRMCRIANLSVIAPQQGKTAMTIELRIALVHGLKPQANI